jgi:nitroimidazol reductase NimA-like FMN-containing flavoprotein (pyridoxamine 5'-phosphate oxidase superfamily)
MEDLDRETAIAILATQPVAHIGVVVDGEPYVSPISFAVVGDELYFRTGRGRRFTAMMENPRVCVEASLTDDQGWDSVIVWGDAHEIENIQKQAEVIEALLEKYSESIDSVLSFSRPSPVADDSAVVGVPLSDVSGRSAGRGLDPSLRPGRL